METCFKFYFMYYIIYLIFNWMIVMSKKPRKQKHVVLHKDKDEALIQAIQNDQSIVFSSLVRQLLREHYQLADKQTEK